MIHTLKEFLDFYKDVDRIQLVIADHSVFIESELKGSMFIIRAFENSKFRQISYKEGLLILTSDLYE